VDQRIFLKTLDPRFEVVKFKTLLLSLDQGDDAAAEKVDRGYEQAAPQER
jgi:hypothetical protein